MKGRVSPEVVGLEEKQNGYAHKGQANGETAVAVSKYDEKDDKKEEKKEEENLVGFFEVFKFSTAIDRVLMIAGTISAAIHGCAIPLMIVVFGEMIDLFVNSGEYEYQVDYMVSLNILSAISLTKSQVIEDPSLLSIHKATILSSSNNTVIWDVIQEAIDNDLLEVMERYAIYFVAIGCGVLVFGYGQVTFWMLASERQTMHIRKSFFRNIMRQNIGWFDTQESGQLNSRLADDISKIHDGIGDKCGHFMQWFCGFLAGFIIGFIYGWKLTLIILAISPLLAGAAFMMSKLVALASGAELKAYAKAGAVAEEVLGAIRTVAAFGGQAKECVRYEENLVEAKSVGVKKGLINGVSMGVVWLVVFGAYGLGFWYGGVLVRDEPENYTVAKIMIVFFSVLMGAFSLGSAAPYIQSFSVARGAAYVVYKLIQQDPPIDSYSEEGLKLDDLQGNIEISGVDFKYPSRPDVQVLDGLSLSINRGQTVALVGSSGCGKSTVVQLIQRFYDPENGRIMVDGVDIKDLNLKWMRQHIGIVSQEPVLFATTIAENIRYGRDGVTQEEIEAASVKANAFDFIQQLPDKFETLVGERGAQLSGGQKQRIAIARALVRDPKILLLDEATSALDTESEGVVQEALEKAAAGRTTIVIAHRLSTIKTADMIAGFKEGKIVEKGTHNELMGKQGIYQQLVNNQTGKTEEDYEAEEFDDEAAMKKKLKHQQSTVLVPQKSVTKGDGDDKDEEKKEEEKVDAGFMRILALNKAEWWSILLGCLGSLINGGLMPAFAVIFAEIIGVYAEPDLDKQKEEIMMYSLMFVGLGLLSLITYFLQGYMFGRSGEALTLTLRSMSFRALLRQEMAYFDEHENGVGALTTRLSTDASQVQGAAGIRVGTVIMSLCSILAGLIIGFIYSWKMTLVILGFVPLMVIGGALQMKMLDGAAGKNKEALEAAGKVAVESIENVRTVASLTREDKFCERFKAELDIPYKAAMKKAHLVGVSFSFSQAVMFYAYAAAFYFGAWLIKQGDIDFIDVFKAFSAIVFGAMGSGQASSFAPDAAKAQTSAEQIFKLLDKKPTIDSESEEGEKPSTSSVSGSVTFSNVEFHYPSRPDVKVLDKLNLSVTTGQTVALVGSSGCGKSTTVQLIERFYDSEGGQVLLDTHDIKNLNVQWLRARIGIVSQEPVLFDRSIADNIAYGDNARDVPIAEIIQAARDANIHEFIASLPEGYDTNVGEKGAQLSGGQKQRVAIARALVRNPQILLLDEATSALDTESEKVVQEALDKARQGRTSIVIAHRLSTIQNADKICVIRHGVVTEEGTHSDLLKRQGFYYKLNQAQARKK